MSVSIAKTETGSPAASRISVNRAKTITTCPVRVACRRSPDQPPSLSNRELRSAVAAIS